MESKRSHILLVERCFQKVNDQMELTIPHLIHSCGILQAPVLRSPNITKTLGQLYSGLPPCKCTRSISCFPFNKSHTRNNYMCLVWKSCIYLEQNNYVPLTEELLPCPSNYPIEVIFQISSPALEMII